MDLVRFTESISLSIVEDIDLAKVKELASDREMLIAFSYWQFVKI